MGGEGVAAGASAASVQLTPRWTTRDQLQTAPPCDGFRFIKSLLECGALQQKENNHDCNLMGSLDRRIRVISVTESAEEKEPQEKLGLLQERQIHLPGVVNISHPKVRCNIQY